MEVAGAHLELGDGQKACELYDEVLKRFPNWWIALLGKVRCGLLVGAAADRLEALLGRAKALGAPAHALRPLQAKVAARGGRLARAADLMLPDAVAGRPVDLPVEQLVLHAWRKGKHRSVVTLVTRALARGHARSSVLRLGAESALLLRDGSATDELMGAILDRHPDPVLGARYLRDLLRRHEQASYRRWLARWRAWGRGSR